MTSGEHLDQAGRQELGLVLRRTLEKKQRHNPRFSLRALARMVDIPAGRLSELMSGKRKLSPFYADKLVTNLALSKEEKAAILASVGTESRRIPQGRKLSEGELALISSWEYYAILNVIKLDAYDGSEAWIAERLNLPRLHVYKSVQLLVRLGLLAKVAERIERTESSLTTENNIPSSAIRSAHRSDIGKALDALDGVETSKRIFSSATVVCDSTSLEQAAKMIDRFNDKFAKKLPAKRKTAVYNLTIQFCPLTKVD